MVRLCRGSTWRRRFRIPWILACFTLIVNQGLAQEASAEMEAADDPADEDGSSEFVPDDFANEEARSRALFEDAHSALAEGRLGDAQWALSESLRLSPRPSTALNLAQVQRNMGRLLNADAILHNILDGEFGLPSAELREGAEALIATMAGEIVTVRVHVEGAVGAELYLDGAPAVVVQRPLRLDPGPHQLSVVTSDGRRRTHRFVARRGESESVHINFSRFETSSLNEVGHTADTSTPTTRSRSVVRSPLFWAILGIAVVGGGAAALAVHINSTHEVREDPGGIFPVVQALSW